MQVDAATNPPSSGPTRDQVDLFHEAIGKDQDQLPPGTCIDRYEVVTLLGAGGMGVIYAATDPELERTVALKLLHPRAGDSGHGQQRLLREAQALARLDSEYVVTIHDVGTHEDGVWLAMEHVEGLTLRQWLRARRSWPDILNVLNDAGRGLAAAHAKHIVHRDFKPDNIMIRRDDRGRDRARVMDFGLARFVTTDHATRTSAAHGRPCATVDPGRELVTQAGALLGTQAYMAPEQRSGQLADERSDQYAFCVTAWEALFGARPAASDAADAPASPPDERRNHDPRPPVPSWLRAILARGLHIDPAARWPSMDTLLAELAFGPPRQRHRRRLHALGALAVLISLVFAWHSVRRLQRSARCVAAGAEIDGVWNAGRKTRLRETLLASGVASAAQIHERAVPWIDRWAREWSGARTQVCRDAELDHPMSPELQQRALDCLAQQRDHLDALLTVLDEADKTSALRTISAVTGLPRLAPCTDPHALERQPPAPTDVGARPRVAELRRGFPRTIALAATGRYREGYAQSQILLASARTIDHAPLTAEAHLLVGRMARLAGDLHRAQEHLEQAYVDAGAISADELAATAAVSLALTVGIDMRRHAEGTSWTRSATMLVRRLGMDDDLLGASLWAAMADLERANGKYAAALTLHTRALAIDRRTLEPDSPVISASIKNLANLRGLLGEYDAALGLHHEALAGLRRTLGPSHIEVAFALGNMANVHTMRGDHEMAHRTYQESLAILLHSLGPDHPEVAIILNNLANVDESRGDLAAAQVAIERALTIKRKSLPAGHPSIAASLNTLGTILRRRGNLVAAQGFMRQALELRERALGPDHIDLTSSLDGLARIEEARGSYEPAEALCQRSLKIREHVLGPRHHRLVHPLTALGRIALARDLPGVARLHLERALAVTAPDTPAAAAAEVRFLLARALVSEPSPDATLAARANDLAHQAAELYQQAGPVHQEALSEVQQWSRDHKI